MSWSTHTPLWPLRRPYIGWRARILASVARAALAPVFQTHIIITIMATYLTWPILAQAPRVRCLRQHGWGADPRCDQPRGMAELELGTLNVITFDTLSNAWQRSHGFLVHEAVKSAAARCTELTRPHCNRPPQGDR